VTRKSKALDCLGRQAAITRETDRPWHHLADGQPAELFAPTIEECVSPNRRFRGGFLLIPVVWRNRICSIDRLRPSLRVIEKTLSTDEARRAFDERIERLLSQHGVDYVRGYVDALKDASSGGSGG
jgi:hypothetical protein